VVGLVGMVASGLEYPGGLGIGCGGDDDDDDDVDGARCCLLDEATIQKGN
jgi:hypothetical protein